MNERYVNTVEYSSESSDNKEANMCIAKWSWGLNLNHSYALALSRLLKADKTKCATHSTLLSVIGIFYYLLQ
jgi:hypothetical protein